VWTLIHISTIFLKDAPEGLLLELSFRITQFSIGTFHIAQAAFARNLSYFNEMSLSWDSRSTALQDHILLQVLHVCQDKVCIALPMVASVDHKIAWVPSVL
jgi:hypothetical protein